MINNIELSPSNIAKCQYCGCEIGKGTPRGVMVEDGGQYKKKYYFCYKCVPKRIEETIKCQRDIKKMLNKLIKKQSKEILLMGLK